MNPGYWVLVVDEANLVKQEMDNVGITSAPPSQGGGAQAPKIVNL